MVDKKNIFHTLQSIVIFIGMIFMLFNINSMMGLQEANEQVPNAVINFTSNLSILSESVQQFTEDGLIQSTLSSVMGQGTTTTADRKEGQPLALKPSKESNHGDVDGLIEGAGEMIVNVWLKGEESVATIRAYEPAETEVVKSVAAGYQPFIRINRPNISNVPIKDEHLDHFVHANGVNHLAVIDVHVLR